MNNAPQMTKKIVYFTLALSALFFSADISADTFSFADPYDDLIGPLAYADQRDRQEEAKQAVEKESFEKLSDEAEKYLSAVSSLAEKLVNSRTCNSPNPPKECGDWKNFLEFLEEKKVTQQLVEPWKQSDTTQEEPTQKKSDDVVVTSGVQKDDVSQKSLTLEEFKDKYISHVPAWVKEMKEIGVPGCQKLLKNKNKPLWGINHGIPWLIDGYKKRCGGEELTEHQLQQRVLTCQMITSFWEQFGEQGAIEKMENEFANLTQEDVGFYNDIDRQASQQLDKTDTSSWPSDSQEILCRFSHHEDQAVFDALDDHPYFKSVKSGCESEFTDSDKKVSDESNKKAIKVLIGVDKVKQGFKHTERKKRIEEVLLKQQQAQEAAQSSG